MTDIDWSQAPEGATHYLTPAGSRMHWRRIEGNRVFRWSFDCEWRRCGGDASSPRYIPRPTPQSDLTHPDNLALTDFAAAMRARLAQCRADGRSGWGDPEQCPPQRLAEGLVRAMRAGKLIDAGNYAMMLWKRADQAGAMARVPGWVGEALSRHERVEWDGTGLPPVDTVCEWLPVKSAPWEQVTIAANVRGRSGAHYVLFETPAPNTWHWEADPKRLRPILTPEQRAAKERDEAVAAMLSFAEDFSHGQAPFKPFFEAIHDAGWRKS